MLLALMAIHFTFTVKFTNKVIQLKAGFFAVSFVPLPYCSAYNAIEVTTLRWWSLANNNANGSKYEPLVAIIN